MRENSQIGWEPSLQKVEKQILYQIILRIKERQFKIC